MIQKSFVMMKPDAVQRRLMGKILSRFEEKGLQIVAVKLMQIDEELAKTHYGEHAQAILAPVDVPTAHHSRGLSSAQCLARRPALH